MKNIILLVAALAGILFAKNNRVLFVIITDGQENSSREYSRAQIKKMISDKQEKYDWEFIFLGANIDAASEAQSIGIKSENALKYENSKEGVSKNFEAAAEISKDVATDNKANSKWRDKVLQDKKWQSTKQCALEMKLREEASGTKIGDDMKTFGAKRALAKNTGGGVNEIYQKNAGGGAETDSVTERTPKNLTRILPQEE